MAGNFDPRKPIVVHYLDPQYREMTVCGIASQSNWTYELDDFPEEATTIACAKCVAWIDIRRGEVRPWQ